MIRKAMLVTTIWMCLAGLITAPVAAAALPQADTPTPADEEAPAATPDADAEANQGDALTLGDLGMIGELNLQGPYDSFTLEFTLPADWKLLPGAELQLDLTAFFSNLLVGQEQRDLGGVVAGALDVWLNDVALPKTMLQDNGQQKVTLPVPSEALQPDPLSGLHRLVIQWDASASCDFNLATSLLLVNTSQFVLPHEVVGLPLNLADFPRPLAQYNQAAAPVYLVTPDKPGAAELQASLSLAAALGRLTGGKLDFNLIPAGQLTEAQRSTGHVVLVGKDGSFDTLLNEVDLPLSAAGAEQPAEGDGALQMAVSPWNPARAVLVVGGASEEAVLKAALALGSGQLVTNEKGDVAVVRAVRAQTPPADYDDEQTLTDLGQKELTFSEFGAHTRQVNFELPAGISVGADAYLELFFNHSQLIDYLRSGIVVRVNDVAVGSVRLSDTTAGVSSVRMIVPPSALHTGVNRIDFQVDLVPRDVCADPRRGSLWVTIFPTTNLYLPKTSLPISSETLDNLGAYPLPLINDNELGSTLVVLPTADPAAWDVAADLLFNLGAHTAGRLSSPALLFAENADPAAMQGKNLLVVGQPSQLAVLEQLKAVLPVPFATGSDLPAGDAFRVEYNLTESAQLGFLEMTPLDGTLAYLVLGNSDEGLRSAAAALQNDAQEQNLAQGNFAIVQGSRLVVENFAAAAAGETAAGDLTPPWELEKTPAAGATPSGGVTAYPVQREPWVMPVLVVSVVGILVLAALEIRRMLPGKRR